MSHFVAAIARDLQQSMCHNWHKVVSAASSTAPAVPDNTENGSLSSLCINFNQSMKRQLKLLVAVVGVLTDMGRNMYSVMFSLLLACCNLFVVPLIPILSSLLFFKDADWATWISKEKKGYWKGKVAWITGASSGVGASLARALADRGAAVILSGRNAVALEQLKASIVQKGLVNAADVLVLPMELVDLESIPSLVRQAVSFKGKVNILFNNAGMFAMEPVSDADWETTEDVLNVNLMAPIRLCQEIVPHMQSVTEGRVTVSGGLPSPTNDNSCHIVFTNSIDGLISLPCRTAYSTCKHGLVAYARTLAGELSGMRRETPCDTKGCARPGGKEVGHERPSVSDKVNCDSCSVTTMTRKLLDFVGHMRNERLPEPKDEVLVTTVFGGMVNTDLTAKRVDSRHKRVAGIQGPTGPGKATALKPLLPEVKDSMSAERFADLMLVSVSNKIAESWVAKTKDMMWMHLAHYAPDITSKICTVMASGFYKQYLKQCSSDVDSTTLTASTTANTSHHLHTEPVTAAR
eukprot:GHVQ01000197.1.p1 GENE.GHVQ01000197.1~~GHVQ01000197.1.p1  ORF type:complete len:520 (-),score=63.94 GHVQ01000197.1:469-2028(-)